MKQTRLKKTEGLKALIYLSSLMGVKQTEDEARAEWDELNLDQKNLMVTAYRTFTNSNLDKLHG